MTVLGVLFASVVVMAGFGVLRGLGLAKGVQTLGFAPATGLAILALITTWAGVGRLLPPIPGGLCVAVVFIGLSAAARDRQVLYNAIGAFLREQRLASTLFAAALAVPCIATGIAFAGVQAPLSPHDGAFHVETSDVFRRGVAALNWYPPGLAAMFGALLQVLPWVDTALGAFQFGLGLALLVPVAVFGLGAAIWRNLRAASAAALLASLTHLLPYYPQVWSGWPQLTGVLLVIGIWTLAIQYLDRPSWPWAVLAGVLFGGIVVVHGTELYTSAIVLAITAPASWRRVDLLRLPVHGAGAIILAFVFAAPYVPALLHWAGSGGAYQVGYEDGTALEHGATTSAMQLLGAFIADALGVDLPVRVVLVALGFIWGFRRPGGRGVVAVTLAFVGMAVVASFFNGVPLVRDVFAATYPWSLPYRHLTFAVVTLSLLAGGGAILASDAWGRFLERMRSVAAHRRFERLGRLLVITWLGLSTWALIAFLSIESGADVSYSKDDAAAMAWLRQNVQSDDVVVNDTFADAGIWAPYKAGVRILMYRSVSDRATMDERRLIEAHVADLDQSPEAAAAACALNARYVYRGAENAAWQVRTFPPLAQLRSSPALQEVFTQGDAAVFRINLNC